MTTSDEDKDTILGSHTLARSRALGCMWVTHAVAAVLVNDDPIRKRFIMGLNVQSTFPRIQ